MRYSTWLKPTCLAISLLSEAAISQQDQAVLDSTPGKNIVFILTDDQDAVLDSVAYMPRLQKHVIDRGTSFVNHFTTTAICCPSRVSLWTGKQPHNTNVTDVSPPHGESATPNSEKLKKKSIG